MKHHFVYDLTIYTPEIMFALHHQPITYKHITVFRYQEVRLTRFKKDYSTEHVRDSKEEAYGGT